MIFKKKEKTDEKPAGLTGEKRSPEQDESVYLSQIVEHFREITGENPDLCRLLSRENPAAGNINDHLETMEARFRHLLENMIQIIGNEKELSGTVGRLDGEAKSQRRSSSEILKEASSFSDSLKALHRHTSETARTAEEAVQTADEGEKELTVLLGHIESIDSNMDQTWRDMEKLNEASSSINELTAMISDTAERLHLISINTAIEASKSNNKSFQVIAREIQKMAGETSQTVTRVDSMIQNILERTKEVESALLSSKDSTKVCLDRSENVKDAFGEINRTNGCLKNDTEKIRDELERGNESVGILFDTSKHISSSAEGISAEADKAAALSENLVAVVNSVITEIGSYRLKWHGRIKSYCEEGSVDFTSLSDYSRESLDRFLENFLSTRPGFELGYILDKNGRQVSSNVQLAEGGHLTREEGFGIDRRDKNYFIRAMEEKKAYLTDIYLSSATEELCVTAAIPAEAGTDTYVIAVDANLKGLIKTA